MSNHYFNIIYTALIPIAFCLSNCANISSPTGGPKDTIPPSLINTIPDNQSLNYKDNTISLTFNEPLKLSNLKNQLLITPRIDPSIYNYKIRKNRIILDFIQPLADSTTYTFNFNESIVDQTEGNIAPPVIFTFSTGSYLDSLRLTGYVYQLYNNEPAPNVTIAIYDTEDTLNYLRDEPLYFAKTDANGNFQLLNLKNSTYQLLAFKDVNDNLILDVSREPYGFLSQPIDPISTPPLELPIQNWNVDTLKSNRQQVSGPYFISAYNKPLLHAYTKRQIKIPFQISTDRKEVKFFNTTGSITDSTLVLLQLTDSSRYTITDSIYVKFEETKRDPDPFTVTAHPEKKSKTTYKFNRKFRVNKPLTTIYTDSIFFSLDTFYTFPIAEAHLHYDTINGFISLNYSFNKDTLDKVYDALDSLIDNSPKEIPDNLELGNQNNFGDILQSIDKPDIKRNQITLNLNHAFLSVESDTADNYNETVSFLQSKGTGIIRGNISTQLQHFFIELYQDNELVRRIVDNKEYIFEYLEPGEYKLRILIDENGNKRWDRGNIFQNQEPEKVYHYPQSIPVKANWEIENEPIEF
jgi:uncharacterized protein (DUF2141 family)